MSHVPHLPSRRPSRNMLETHGVVAAGGERRKPSAPGRRHSPHIAGGVPQFERQRSPASHPSTTRGKARRLIQARGWDPLLTAPDADPNRSSPLSPRRSHSRSSLNVDLLVTTWMRAGRLRRLRGGSHRGRVGPSADASRVAARASAVVSRALAFNVSIIVPLSGAPYRALAVVCRRWVRAHAPAPTIERTGRPNAGSMSRFGHSGWTSCVQPDARGGEPGIAAPSSRASSRRPGSEAVTFSSLLSSLDSATAPFASAKRSGYAHPSSPDVVDADLVLLARLQAVHRLCARLVAVDREPHRELSALPVPAFLTTTATSFLPSLQSSFPVPGPGR